MYNNNILIKSFFAIAAIAANTIVKFDADDDTVSASAAAGDAHIGVTNELGATAEDAAEGATIDVVICGIAEIRLGGAVIRGEKLTSDASGLAIAGAAGNQAIGVAFMSGVANDVIPVLLNQSTI